MTAIMKGTSMLQVSWEGRKEGRKEGNSYGVEKEFEQLNA